MMISLIALLWLLKFPLVKSEETITFTYTPDNIPHYCGRNAFDNSWANLFTNEPTGSSSLLHIKERIVGGTPSQLGQWPWMVSLMLKESAEEVQQNLVGEEGNRSTFNPPTILHTLPDGSRTYHLCAGTLIHPEWILTVAHCFFAFEPYVYISTDADRWIARVGEFDMLDDQEPHFDMKLEHIYIHPDFETFSPGGGVTHDIALIKLQTAVPLGPNVNIACLPESGEVNKPWDQCIAAGWGHTDSESMNISSALRHMTVTIFPRELCLETYDAIRHLYGTYIPHIQKSMFCAGDKEGGKDSCSFDSGGPLLSQHHNQWHVNGLTSFGLKCGKPGSLGVYTNVSAHLPWILSHIPDLVPMSECFQ